MSDGHEPLNVKEKVVVLHNFSQEELREVTKAVVQVLGSAENLVFAVTTPTSLEWKVGDLIVELAEEQRRFLEWRKNKKSEG